MAKDWHSVDEREKTPVESNAHILSLFTETHECARTYNAVQYIASVPDPLSRHAIVTCRAVEIFIYGSGHLIS